MTKWLYRALGAVGVAGGALLLSSGAAHADDVVPAGNPDLQQVQGIIDDLLTPTAGGLKPLGLSLDTPGTTLQTGLVDQGPLKLVPNDGRMGVVAHTPSRDGTGRDVYLTGRLPDILDSVPVVKQLPLTKLTGAEAPLTGLPVPLSDMTPRQAEGLPSLPLVQSVPTEELPLVGDLPLLGDLLGSATSDPAAGDPAADPNSDRARAAAALAAASQALSSSIPATAGAPAAADPATPANIQITTPGESDLLAGGVPLAGGAPLEDGLPLVGGLVSGLPLVGSLPLLGGLAGDSAPPPATVVPDPPTAAPDAPAPSETPRQVGAHRAPSAVPRPIVDDPGESSVIDETPILTELIRVLPVSLHLSEFPLLSEPS